MLIVLKQLAAEYAAQRRETVLNWNRLMRESQPGNRCFWWAVYDDSKEVETRIYREMCLVADLLRERRVAA